MLAYLILLLTIRLSAASNVVNCNDGTTEPDLQLLLHDDSKIVYSPVVDGSNGFCPRDTNGCKNSWWQEPKSTSLSLNCSETMHTTQLGSENRTMSVAFTGSRTIAVLGKVDGGAKKATRVTISTRTGNTPIPIPAQPKDEGRIFEKTDVKPQHTYTMTLQYSGQYSGVDFLRIMAVGIDSSGTFLDISAKQTSEPSQPGSSADRDPQAPTPTTHTDRDPLNASTATVTHSDLPPSASPSLASTKSSVIAPGSTKPAVEVSPPVGPTMGQKYSATTMSDMAAPSTTQSVQLKRGRKGRGAIIGGIVAGVLIFILILALAALYLRRRVRARRAPSYAFRTRTFHQDAHWTERPISPIVPSSAEWESFALPLEKDGQVETKKQIQSVQTPLFDERRATLGSESGLGLAL